MSILFLLIVIQMSILLFLYSGPIKSDDGVVVNLGIRPFETLVLIKNNTVIIGIWNNSLQFWFNKHIYIFFSSNWWQETGSWRR